MRVVVRYPGCQEPAREAGCAGEAAGSERSASLPWRERYQSGVGVVNPDECRLVGDGSWRRR
jgi:hypothetical protein